MRCKGEITRHRRKCYNAALECRRRASEIAEADRDLGIVFLISPNLTPEISAFRRNQSRRLHVRTMRDLYKPN